MEHVYVDNMSFMFEDASALNQDISSGIGA